MGDELQFRKKLQELLEKADSQDKRIGTDEVNAFFAEDALTEEQMLLVYEFLMSQKIIVTGYYKNTKAADGSMEGADRNMQETKAVGTAPEGFTAEEAEYLREYMEDLAAMKPAEEGELEELFEAAAQQDALAKSRLIELYLPTVVEIAKELHEPGIYLGDMVQEGNVSLILAVDMITDADRADTLIRGEVQQGILAMIEEQKEAKRRDKKMEQQVNDLDDTLHKMAEEKGRAVTMEELAEYMKIPEEEILDIMKLAGEDLYDKYKDGREQDGE